MLVVVVLVWNSENYYFWSAPWTSLNIGKINSNLGFNFTEYEIKVNSYGITRVYKKRWIRQFIQMLFSILIQNIWALYTATYPEDSNSRPMDHSYFIKQIAFDLMGKEQPWVNLTVRPALIFVLEWRMKMSEIQYKIWRFHQFISNLKWIQERKVDHEKINAKWMIVIWK